MDVHDVLIVSLYEGWEIAGDVIWVYEFCMAEWRSAKVEEAKDTAVVAEACVGDCCFCFGYEKI